MGPSSGAGRANSRESSPPAAPLPSEPPPPLPSAPASWSSTRALELSEPADTARRRRTYFPLLVGRHHNSPLLGKGGSEAGGSINEWRRFFFLNYCCFCSYFVLFMTLLCSPGLHLRSINVHSDRCSIGVEAQWCNKVLRKLKEQNGK